MFEVVPHPSRLRSYCAYCTTYFECMIKFHPKWLTPQYKENHENIFNEEYLYILQEFINQILPFLGIDYATSSLFNTKKLKSYQNSESKLPSKHCFTSAPAPSMNKLFSLQWPRGVLVSIFILGMSRPLGLFSTVGSWVQSEISRYTLKQNKKYPLTQSKKYLDILWSRAMIYLTSLVSWIETWVGERSSITLRCTISHWNTCTAKCTYYLQLSTSNSAEIWLMKLWTDPCFYIADIFINDSLRM